MKRFFVDIKGNYLGGFTGAEPPVGSVEIAAPPSDGRQKWKDGVFLPLDSKLVWDFQISQNDLTSRDIENIIEALDASVRARINSTTLAKYNAKKTLRASRL